MDKWSSSETRPNSDNDCLYQTADSDNLSNDRASWCTPQYPPTCSDMRTAFLGIDDEMREVKARY